MSVNNFEELIRSYLQKNRKKFVSYDCKNLLSAGENYGSVMLALDIKVRTENDKEDIIQCVAKTVPPSQAVWDLFNVPVTFKKEIAHYKIVVPALDEFGKENGIDNLMYFFANCLAARISQDPKSDIVDKDAVLLLENLKVSGYEVADRFTGFDKATSKLIIKDMATFHGAVIAFKLIKPEEFKTKILPHLIPGVIFVPSDELLDNLIGCITKYASCNSKCVPLLPRVREGIKKMKTLFKNSTIREPFGTIAHCDMWTNNIMIKTEDGEPRSSIFVDFQGNIYSSPARDLLFFLYSSVKLEILEANVDELIKYYHEQLLVIIEKLKCDPKKFNYELFMKEVDEVAKEEFSHLLFMYTPLFTLKGEAKELAEWTVDHLVPENEQSLHENYHDRLYFTILDFAKRNWI